MRWCFLLLMTGMVGGCGLAEVDSKEPLFVVYILSPVGGSFTVEHHNEFGAGGGPTDPSGKPSTFQGTGNFQEVIRQASYGHVDPSLQELHGSFTGEYLEARFGTRTYDSSALGDGPGAESGSLQNLAGPDPQLSACSIRYGASEGQGSSYRVQFRFTATVGRVCREP